MRSWPTLRPLRRAGVDPERVALVLALAVRTVPVLVGIGAEVQQARAARGAERSVRAFAVPFVIRSLRHADRLGEALEARGVDDSRSPGTAWPLRCCAGSMSGATGRIKMADLREALTAAGFGRVRTVLQSGNCGPRRPRRRAGGGRAAGARRRARVLRVRRRGTGADGGRAGGRRRAEPDDRATDGARYVVVFLAGPADDVELPDLPESTEERWWRSGSEIYVWCPGGLLESPVMEHFGGTAPSGSRHGPELEHGDGAGAAHRRVTSSSRLC